MIRGEIRPGTDSYPLHRTIENQAVQRSLKSNGEEREDSSLSNTSPSFAHDFSRIPLHAKAQAKIQPKPTINTPGDIYEQEANRVDDRVMEMPEPQVHRTCACGGDCPKCKNSGRSPGQTLLQTKLTQTTSPAEAAAPPVVDEVLGQTGHPLDASTRNFMEPRFGVDFSRVQLHTGWLAAKSAKAIGARAFTVGNDIVFGAAQYMPGSKATQRLLAHELTHVVQQSQLGGASYGKISSIQRQSDGSDEGANRGGRAGAQGASLASEYIELACEVIADIRRGVEEGRTWIFEDELLLQGEALLMRGRRTLLDERTDALQELVRGLSEIIRDLESGALVPSDPASRRALADLWDARNPSTIGLAQRWTPAFRHVRSPSGQLIDLYPSLGSYISRSALPESGMLPSASFPTWWVLGCQPSQQPAQPPARSERITPDELGRDTVIFISRNGRVVTGWDWEPRTESYPEAFRPFGPYEWHYDRSAGRVFIVVDGKQLNLLRNGRVEIQQ